MPQRSRGRTSGRLSSAGRTLKNVLSKIPLALGYIILFTAWAGFTFPVSINQVLLERHKVWRFVAETCIFQPLVILAVLSLYATSTTSPGYAPRPPAQRRRRNAQGKGKTSRTDRHPSDSIEMRQRAHRPASLVLPVENHHPAASAEAEAEADPDDVPLRYLRNSAWVTNRLDKARPSPLPLPSHRTLRSSSSGQHAAGPLPTGAVRVQSPLDQSDVDGDGRASTSASTRPDSDTTSETALGAFPRMPRFPLSAAVELGAELSPFVPSSAREARGYGHFQSAWMGGTRAHGSEAGYDEHSHRDVYRGVARDASDHESTRESGDSGGDFADDSRETSDDCTSDEDEDDYDDDDDDDESDARALLSREAGAGSSSPVLDLEPDLEAGSGFGSGPSERQGPILAKAETGGRRYCRKCRAVKPDRAHHCRLCGVCVLKMDHHCIWVGTCVGYRNYKPFLLFITYATLLALYTAIESALQLVAYLVATSHPQRAGASASAIPMHTQPLDTLLALAAAANRTDIDPAVASAELPMPMPRRGSTTGDVSAAGGAVEFEFAPVAMMLLVFTGGFFTLSVGGLAVYHWYLTVNNLTTLEHISHAYPTALLPPSPHTHTHPPGASGARHPRPQTSTSASTPTPTWRPDHLLSRDERLELRASARALNVFDLGAWENVCAVLLDSASRARGRRGRGGASTTGGGSGGVARLARLAWAIRHIPRMMWPLTTPPDALGGMAMMPYDPDKLERLREVTRRLRVDARVAEADERMWEDV